ncbi:S-layer homology domain-containing protein [Geosporobacter ferrireducens]|nr:S-layer homology domain-containing protein [Geosporobacter ferrireducens]
MNTQMKKKIRTLLVSLITLSMVFMFITPNMVYAEIAEEVTAEETETTDSTNEEEVNEEEVDEEEIDEEEVDEEEVDEEVDEEEVDEEEVDEEEVDEEEVDEEEVDEEEVDEEEIDEETPERKLFTDVPENHWAFDVIHELRDKDIVKGMSETEFAPAKQMTRAEFVTLLVNTLGLEATGSSRFVDISENAWYANTVQAAYEAGIVKGMSETHFAPNKNITREEMATMILQAYELKIGEKVEDAEEATFADEEQISAWAKENVNKVVAVGLMKGRAEDQFAPKGITNRAEGAQVIFNLLNK